MKGKKLHDSPQTIKKVPSAFRTLFSRLADCIAPHICCGCRTEGTPLCRSCFLRITFIPHATCVHCRTETDGTNTCARCAATRHPYIKKLAVSSWYKDPLVRTAITNLKYKGVAALAKPLAELLARTLEKTPLPTRVVLCPVPMTKRRRRVRGADHTLLITQHLSRCTGIPYAALLGRSGNPKPQVSCSLERRRTNVHDSFRVIRSLPDETKYIILIDDVVTTGSTLNAAGEAFRATGARVAAAVVAAG